MPELSGPGAAGVSDGYDVPGLPPVKLLFQAAGPIEQVAPELCRSGAAVAQPDAVPAGAAPQAEVAGGLPRRRRGAELRTGTCRPAMVIPAGPGAPPAGPVGAGVPPVPDDREHGQVPAGPGPAAGVRGARGRAAAARAAQPLRLRHLRPGGDHDGHRGAGAGAGADAQRVRLLPPAVLPGVGRPAVGVRAATRRKATGGTVASTPGAGPPRCPPRAR